MPDHDVDVVILHRRVEDLFDSRIEAVDLVDKKHVALFEVGQDRGQVAGFFDDRAGGGFERRTHLVSDDVRKRGLADARRAGQQDVVESLTAFERRLHKDAQVLLDLGLADIFRQMSRPQAGVKLAFVLVLIALMSIVSILVIQFY